MTTAPGIKLKRGDVVVLERINSGAEQLACVDSFDNGEPLFWWLFTPKIGGGRFTRTAPQMLNPVHFKLKRKAGTDERDAFLKRAARAKAAGASA